MNAHDARASSIIPCLQLLSLLVLVGPSALTMFHAHTLKSKSLRPNEIRRKAYELAQQRSFSCTYLVILPDLHPWDPTKTASM